MWRRRVSSSSSTDLDPASAHVAGRLAHAFGILAAEAQTAHGEIARRLGERRVRIAIDDEVFDVTVMQGEPRVCEPHGDALVTIATSRALVRDVLAGRCSVAEALRDDSLRARGALRDLVAALGALEAFVHGAVRCKAMPALFQEFQTERVA